jgi:hypothetical protein
MGLDIWFAEDIRNALLAANEASAATAAVIAEVGVGPSTGSGQGPSTLRQAQSSGQAVTDSAELLTVSLRAYREGYRAALATVALAFGIAPRAIALPQAQGEALRPFDCAQDRPFDAAQDRPFDCAQDRPFDAAQDRPFDCAQDRPFDELGTMQAQYKRSPGSGEEP